MKEILALSLTLGYNTTVPRYSGGTKQRKRRYML